MNRWIVVVGAVLIQLALGTIYCWGNLTTYVTAYIKLEDTTITSSDTLWIFAVGLMAFALTMIFAGQLQQNIGPMKVAILGGICVTAGVLLSAAMTNLVGLLLTYGVLFGVGIGFAYVCPIACAGKWFPDKKGMINGIAVAGFGAGAFIFNKITTAFVNPANVDTQSIVDLSSQAARDVAGNVPGLFILLGIIYAVMIVGGALTLRNPPEDWKPAGWQPPAPSPESGVSTVEIPREQAIKTAPFWMLWLMFVLTATAGLFVIGNYKVFGQDEIGATDVFLSDVGAWAALFNGAGRVVWGTLADKITYKKAMYGMFGFQTVLLFTLSLTASSQAMFFLWVCLIYFCFGGNFSLYPTATADTFGSKNLGPNYGIIFTAYGIAGVSGALLASTLRAAIGFSGLFIIMAVLSIVAIVVAVFVKPPSVPESKGVAEKPVPAAGS